MASSYKRNCTCEKCSAIRSRSRAFQNRQADGTDLFLIEIFRNGQSFAIIAWDCPDDSYAKGVGHHHRYDDGTLCQRAGYESRTLEHAEAFAHWWMKRWSIYVRTGTFPMTRESVDVPD